MKNKLILILFAATILFSTLGYATYQNRTINTWLPYWDTKNSIENFKSNFQDKIEEINLFFYCLDKDANIINILPKEIDYQQIINIFRQANVKIILTITNDVIYSKSEKKLKDPQILHQILNDSNLRQRHIQQIIEIVEKINADGIDIDYENIDIKDKDNFSEFIKEFTFLLHNKNKILNVTVQQKTEDHNRTGAGAVDWKEISQYADKITIMCYNYSSKISKPGPLCPTFWLKEIIEFAKSQIPQDKICIALALHGYEWSENEVKPLNLKQVETLIEEYNAKLKWERKSKTPYFKYYKNGMNYEVWFENQKSISEKIKIIKKSKIQQIALWHLSILDYSLIESTELFLK